MAQAVPQLLCKQNKEDDEDNLRVDARRKVDYGVSDNKNDFGSSWNVFGYFWYQLTQVEASTVAGTVGKATGNTVDEAGQTAVGANVWAT